MIVITNLWMILLIFISLSSAIDRYFPSCNGRLNEKRRNIPSEPVKVQFSPFSGDVHFLSSKSKSEPRKEKDNYQQNDCVHKCTCTCINYQGRRAAQTSGTSTYILSPTKSVSDKFVKFLIKLFLTSLFIFAQSFDSFDSFFGFHLQFLLHVMTIYSLTSL